MLNEEKITKKFAQIYSEGKSPDSPGSFRPKRTRKFN